MDEEGKNLWRGDWRWFQPGLIIRTDGGSSPPLATIVVVVIDGAPSKFVEWVANHKDTRLLIHSRRNVTAL